jgi:hypothetical protein
MYLFSVPLFRLSCSLGTCVAIHSMDDNPGPGNAVLTSQTSGRPTRTRRAVVACMNCRRRKIRCDVTLNGVPCTNCQLDNNRCVIVNPRRQHRITHAERPEQSLHEVIPTRSFVTADYSAASHMLVIGCSANVRAEGDQNFYLPCLSAENLRMLPPHDVAYLSSRKALTFPKKATIKTLLQVYFLHIHPCFPVVKESEFHQSACNQRPFSLLVFRSMLFAAACVHPPCR